MKKWEYEVQDFYSWNQVKDDLTKMGEQGWELVAVLGTRFFLSEKSGGSFSTIVLRAASGSHFRTASIVVIARKERQATPSITEWLAR